MNPIFKGIADKKYMGCYFPCVKFDPYTLERIGKHIASCEGYIELIIRKQKSQRSLNQNSAYWGIAIEILSECEVFGGYTKEEIHDALRKEFLSTVDPKTGLTKIRSTTDLSTIEFNDYYATIQRWAASFCKVYIPDPNEPPLDLAG
jgi:hypothetical protein